MSFMGKVFLDMEFKEYVLVSNGVCSKSHSSCEAFSASHNGVEDCTFVASEAIAIRVIGMRDDDAGPHANAGPILAWTYRKVDSTKLAYTDFSREDFEAMLKVAGDDGGRI